ncbi:hypothetical protein [Novacetimonas hansenii]|uniref:hypothetical protein n=1 Tax=Novacetimonas hansenii TaxID=436 RepID=UPI0023DD5A94|nr:hypothetical protein [Novacetimonas hansenii]WEQ60557.1 hypothetical protein LV563_15210 [Novacetimonas hansenii]
MIDIRLGSGPAGNFDAAHLKAIHQHLFGRDLQMGRTYAQRAARCGWTAGQAHQIHDQGQHDFPAGFEAPDRGLAEAFRPIRDPDVLKGSNVEQFSAVARSRHVRA